MSETMLEIGKNIVATLAAGGGAMVVMFVAMILQDERSFWFRVCAVIVGVCLAAFCGGLLRWAVS